MLRADNVATREIQAIDANMLALCVQGVQEAAGPLASPEHIGKKAAEFYLRLMAMQSKKAEAA